MAGAMGAIWFYVFIVWIARPDEAVAASIGVNYGRIADDLPSPSQVVQLLVSQNIDKVKIYDADAGFLYALAESGTSVAVMVPDELIGSVSSSMAQAQLWVSANILPYLPATKITTIMVGNEILTQADPSLTPLLVPAMKNIYSSLQAAGLEMAIKVTTPHALDVLDPASSFPPSSGAFRPSLASSVFQPLLDFLADTGSFFMLDVYPYFAYNAGSGQQISLEYALFGQGAVGVDDPITGLHYSNLFDAQMDAVYSAMGKLNHSGMRIVVSETGWPSAGGPQDVGATLANAAMYNANLLRHVLSDPPMGTPLKPGVAFDTYIFELFNEDLKTGDLTERNFGLFYPNMTEVTYVSFSVGSGDESKVHVFGGKRWRSTCYWICLCMLWELLVWRMIVY